MSHIGLNGLDPVAFLGHFQSIMGKAKYKSHRKGKVYFFSSQANLEIFELRPERFLPQIDAFCPLTYALTGKFVAGRSDCPNVVGDKLFFYANPYYASICKLCPWILSLADRRYHRISVQRAA